MCIGAVRDWWRRRPKLGFLSESYASICKGFKPLLIAKEILKIGILRAGQQLLLWSPLLHGKMGPNQSKNAGGSNAPAANVKTSYYELLGIERQATEEECVLHLERLIYIF